MHYGTGLCWEGFLKFFIRVKMLNFDGHLMHDNIVFKGVKREGRSGRIGIDKKRKG